MNFDLIAEILTIVYSTLSVKVLDRKRSNGEGNCKCLDYLPCLPGVDPLAHRFDKRVLHIYYGGFGLVGYTGHKVPQD